MTIYLRQASLPNHLSGRGVPLFISKKRNEQLYLQQILDSQNDLVDDIVSRLKSAAIANPNYVFSEMKDLRSKPEHGEYLIVTKASSKTPNQPSKVWVGLSDIDYGGPCTKAVPGIIGTPIMDISILKENPNTTSIHIHMDAYGLDHNWNKQPDLEPRVKQLTKYLERYDLHGCHELPF
ncbi:MAG: hypothetical protein KKF89_03660 [Nanoarchaeota archaeon]|nr:hypothetical protein [Nanoarchaeota archaeon]MBU1854792.1 hypothetical protein [Nanoarchaeota archaeon]